VFRVGRKMRVEILRYNFVFFSALCTLVPGSRSIPTRSFLLLGCLLVLWLLIVVEFVSSRLAVLILFRSLCTEENVYSIEPIYPPLQASCTICICTLWFLTWWKRMDGIKFGCRLMRQDAKASATHRRAIASPPLPPPRPTLSFPYWFL